MKKLSLFAIVLGTLSFSGAMFGYAARTTIINKLNRDISFTWMSNKSYNKFLATLVTAGAKPDFTIVPANDQYTERVGHRFDMLVVQYYTCSGDTPKPVEITYDAGAKGYGTNNDIEVKQNSKGEVFIEAITKTN